MGFFSSMIRGITDFFGITDSKKDQQREREKREAAARQKRAEQAKAAAEAKQKAAQAARDRAIAQREARAAAREAARIAAAEKVAAAKRVEEQRRERNRAARRGMAVLASARGAGGSSFSGYQSAFEAIASGGSARSGGFGTPAKTTLS